jgi:uncharacterized protein
MIKKISIGILSGLAALCLLLGGALYFGQESLIFHPHKLAADYAFEFNGKFEEMTFTAEDGNRLSGVLFKADSSKGLIFYLHGNAGSLDTWGDIADTYTNLHYDILILDYRGFGKSQGAIKSEAQFYSDIQTVYDSLKHRYAENNTVIIGYSIGTGPAATLAAANHPKLLILQAPYYSLGEMSRQRYPLAPLTLLKYKFETFRGISNTKAPVVVFHGTSDQVIDYGQSVKLKEHFKPADRLITLPDQQHGKMNENEIYRQELKTLLQ